MRYSDWKKVGLLITIPGLLSSIYLAYHAAVAGSVLYCPTTGAFGCDQVTSSPYSSIFGVNVAYLGLAWFIVMFALFAVEKEGPMLPVWAVGVAFVAYLMGAEIFLIHSICVYCTVAHACGILLGLPVLKLPDAEV